MSAAPELCMAGLASKPLAAFWQGVSGEDVSKGVCGFVPVYAWGRRVCEFRIGIHGRFSVMDVDVGG